MGKPVPAQVQKQADRADALLEEMKKSKTAPEEKVEVVEKVEQLPPLPKEPEDHKVKTDSEETWQHKFQVLQGKYNSEIKEAKENNELVPSLKAQIKSLQQRMQEGDILARNLQEQLKKKEAATPGPSKIEMPDNILSLLSEEEKNHFDEEGIDPKSIEILGRVMKQLSLKAQSSQPPIDGLDDIRAEFQEIKNDKVRTFWKSLNEKVSDWEVINSSEPFNDWLDELIPYTDMTRRQALQSAQNNLDASKAIQIFADFKNTQVKQQPKKPLVDPEELIEPSSTAGSHNINSNPKTGKTYSREEVKTLYRELANKLSSGKITQDEADKIDRELFEAQKTGRITN